MTSLKSGRTNKSEPDDPTAQLLRAHVTPLPSATDTEATLARVFDSFGDCKVLLIGDGSHGTSEFYNARAALTKYMVEHHGFNIVAVEADWPDAEAVDRYVRRRPGPGPRASVQPPGEAEKAGRDPAFMRFPTWMWRNKEVQGFVEWLRHWNADKDSKAPDSVGFYGLDLYSLLTSMHEVIRYLEHVDPDMAQVARQRYEKLMTWGEDPHEYGLETLVRGFKGYEEEVVSILTDLLAKRIEYSSVHWNGDEFHSAEQNARLVVDAESYYKSMYYGRNESWNLRDTHMFQTLNLLLKHRGPTAQAIVWAHNSHVGDARATSMGGARDELNIGQLCKETYGDHAALLIGCGTYSGTVAAAHRWDSDMQVMNINPALPGSYEDLMHATGVKNFALDLRKGRCDEELRRALMRQRLQRFIGVIYRPDTELQSHYSKANLPEQFDGFIFFDESKHVGALEAHQPHTDVEYEETWPFGL
ncbi:hypothetical protein ACRALDRAFT_2093636 [Sodiomyces alcalophilus JCM 7366]|uniref:uncharacterized protein n=1 Tax=Sodiomyces alcalophilus JCM 7366 TaxID=591952 RepID=UPI0039B635C8